MAIGIRRAGLIEPWMLQIVHDLYGHNIPYQEVVRIFKEDFGMLVAQRDVELYFEPTLEEEVQDLDLLYARI